MTIEHVAIVGAGAWGIALAGAILRAGRQVLLATRDRAGAEALAERRASPRLPGLRLDERIGVAPLSAEVGELRYGPARGAGAAAARRHAGAGAGR